jgi:hypothetical protein
MPNNNVASSIGDHELRGKSERLELFALECGKTDQVDHHGHDARAFADADTSNDWEHSGQAEWRPDPHHRRARLVRRSPSRAGDLCWASNVHISNAL